LALVSAGREQEDHATTVDSLTDHVRTMLRAIDRLQTCGYSFGERWVDILATAQRAELGDRIAARLSGTVVRKTLDHPYYTGGLRYSIWVTPPAGQPVPLADGGAFDWLATLTSNRRATYVASGMGAQLIALRFRERQQP
jgi:hypothetical protein